MIAIITSPGTSEWVLPFAIAGAVVLVVTAAAVFRFWTRP